MAVKEVWKSNAYSQNTGNDLVNIHTEVMEGIKDAISKTRSLVGKGKSFDSKGINEWVKSFLATYEQKVSEQLQKSFQKTEETLGEIQKLIAEQDNFKE